ncbi:MAG: TonB C-terminal domain-containing protein [Candidatus Omnitrophica bacterium]|nr:TonB C-terminal domain-containing protein [Candidatus Omnitrophota bacterium]
MKNYFPLALVISLGIHIVIIGGLSHFPLSSFKKPSLKSPETKFIEVKKKKITSPKKIFSKIPPPYLDVKKEFFLSPEKKNNSFKKIQLKNDVLLNLKELILTKTKQELDSYPPYMNYYEKIREKIKKVAYENFNVNFSGKVFLNFTIDSSGNLITIYLDEKNSSAPQILKKIAEDSIEKSSPFPKFPKELAKFNTLTFNLSIQFKTN